MEGKEGGWGKVKRSKMLWRNYYTRQGWRLAKPNDVKTAKRPSSFTS